MITYVLVFCFTASQCQVMANMPVEQQCIHARDFYRRTFKNSTAECYAKDVGELVK